MTPEVLIASEAMRQQNRRAVVGAHEFDVVPGGDIHENSLGAASGVEPPIEQRVRRIFGLLERFAPAVGSRWAIELWCTPSAVEMSQRMPPGVPSSTPVDAAWSGHRIAGETWGDGPTVYLVHAWGGCRAYLGGADGGAIRARMTVHMK